MTMHSQDFIPKDNNETFTGGYDEDSRAQVQPNDFVSQSMASMMGFPPQSFSPNFMDMSSQGGMYYPQYSNQYMPYPYGYMSSPYKGSSGYYEKKSHHNYKKSYPRSTTRQVYYTKKSKEPLKSETGDVLAEDFKKLAINETKVPDGTTEKQPSDLESAQFFVIKSYSEDDVYKAIKYNVWCSTRDGNVKLNDAFVTANNKYPIFLLFSVNGSGHFVGVAQMKSVVDFENSFDGWSQTQKWKGVFKISWIYIKDIPNREFRHLKNEYNEDKPIPNSRDSQEAPNEIGVQVLKIFETYKNQTSILDDFEFYEVRETKK